MKRTIFILVVSALVISFVFAHHQQIFKKSNLWAEDTLQQMTLDEKIGQLFVIATTTAHLDQSFFANGLQWVPRNLQNKIEPRYTQYLIKNYHIGGLLFLGSGGSPDKQLRLTNHYQSLSKYPLLIAQDLEWGLSMRLNNVVRFPHNMTLGALQDEHLIYKLGKEIGRQTKLLGVHVNFAPVVDVNNNPENPVISDRSFGENSESVARKGTLFMQGLHDAGIIACAKHFPGHGDTAVDSHCALPRIPHSRSRLDVLELYPFKKLIAAGVKAMMLAHLEVPALEKQPNLPSSLSKSIVTDLLRNELGFNGLVITDSLAMEGVVNLFGPGETELQALLAGNDILLAPTDVPRAVELIKGALADGRLSEETLDGHVLKILQSKEWAHADILTSEENLPELFTDHARNLQQKLYEQALTVINNKKVIPIAKNSDIIHVTVGNPSDTLLADTLAKYTTVTSYHLSTLATAQQCAQLFDTQPTDKTIVISLHNMNKFAKKNFGLSTDMYAWINNLAKTNKVVLALFGSPYSLAHFSKKIGTIIVAYEDIDATHAGAAQILTGNLVPLGKLPVSAGFWQAES